MTEDEEFEILERRLINNIRKAMYPPLKDVKPPKTLAEAIDEMTADSMQVGGTHYKEMDPQPWEVMKSLLTPEEWRGYLKGNMIKYAMRQGKKDSPDAGKYWHYKQKLAEESGGDTWV